VVDEAPVLDRRALRRLFPGHRLFAAVRLAFDFRKLVIAAMGLSLLQLGWLILDQVSPGSAVVVPDVFAAATANAGAGPDTGFSDPLAGLSWRLSEPMRALLSPLAAFHDPASSWRTMLRALVSLLWLFVVWGIFGGAISRIAVLQAAQMRQTGVAEALRFAARSAGSLILAPCCPVLALVFCAAIAAAFGLVYWVPFVGPALSGILLILPLGMSLVMALLAAGLIAGWPLMQAAVAAGAEDALDALSRTFSYLNQRIGAFAAAVGLVWLLGLAGLFLVDLLADGVLRLTRWGLGLTAPAAQIAAYFDGSAAPAGAVAAVFHAFWLGLVRLVAHGWIYSFYWTAAALVYLWLRQQVDGTPWQETEPPGARARAAAASMATTPHAGESVTAPPAAG
jgi:hypothetical protein